MTATTTLKATLLTAVVAVIPTLSQSAELREAPVAVLAAWAEAYAVPHGARTAELYTPDAVIWDRDGRDQVVGHAAIRSHFDHYGLGVAAIEVQFGQQGLREIAPGVAVASGDCTFLTERWDGSIEAAPSRFSMTLVRGTDGGWRIAEQHMSYTPAASR